MRRLGPRGGSKRFRLGELHSEGSIRGVLRSSKRNIAGLTAARRIGFYDLPALMAEEKAARAARAKAQLLLFRPGSRSRSRSPQRPHQS